MADLYFWASKLIGFFLEPLHALGLLTALTLVTLSRWRPRARQIGVLCLLVSWGLLGALPLWHTLLGTLENRRFGLRHSQIRLLESLCSVEPSTLVAFISSTASSHSTVPPNG